MNDYVLINWPYYEQFINMPGFESHSIKMNDSYLIDSMWLSLYV